ncbi:hypothetical protein Q7P37_007199 [Cladosporium fusiforme]
MGELSRASSRRPILPPQDDTESLTSFPDPAPASPITAPSPTMAEHMYGLLDRSEPTMFDERPAVNADDPRALSAADSAVLQGVLDHHGAINLVKRLSEALAERDAHITALQRLCEEYKVPKDRITDAASRVKQAERRRLSLSAASEDLAPSGGTQSESSTIETVPKPTTVGGTVRGLTRLFGGVPRKRDPGQRSITPSSSRSASIAPKPKDRTASIDSRSIDAQSQDSVSWTTTLFSGGTVKRRESKAPREPVEMQAQHDPDDLPPTLTENSQDPQEAEWNRFIVRLNNARQQGGEQEAQGTLLGAARFGREGNAGRAKMETLNRLIVGGIPNRLRHPIWMELSNTYALMSPDEYRHYLSQGENEDALEIDAILKDVPRTLTEQFDYYVDKGHDKLKRLLVAFVAKYKGLGYTQGLNMIAGHLLLAIPAEEDAFWVLCNMVDHFFPTDYFSRDAPMHGALADNAVLRSYVRELLPKVDEKLSELDIDAAATFQPGWHLTALANRLPRTALQRVWDIWLCLPRQKTFLFNVVLAMMKLRADEILALGSSAEYNAFDWRVPDEAGRIDELVRAALMLRKKVDGEQVALRREAEMKRLRRSSSTHALYSPD